MWNRNRNNKLGNHRTTCVAGHSHRSKLESAVCAILQLRLRAGEIKVIQAEDHVYLTRARILYVADFRCTRPDGSTFFVEAKGYADQKWPIKKKLYRFYGPAPLEIWVGTWANPRLEETIYPETDLKDDADGEAL